MRLIALALALFFPLLTPVYGDEPIDVDAFCKSLREDGSAIKLVTQRVIQSESKTNIKAIAFSADMTRFATIDTRGGLAVWDTKTGKVVSRLRAKVPDYDTFTCVALSHGGRVVVAGTGRHGCYVIHANDGRAAKPVATDIGKIVQVAFNKDSQYIVIATHEGKCVRCRLDGSDEQRCEAPAMPPSVAEIQRVAIPNNAEHISYYVGDTRQLHVNYFSKGPDQPALKLSVEIPFNKPILDLVSTRDVTYLATMESGLVAVSLPRAQDDSYSWQSLPMHIYVWGPPSLTPDERWLMFRARSSWIDIRPVSAPLFPMLFRLPIEAPQAVAMGSDGRTILCADEQKSIFVLRLSAPAESPALRAALTLRKLLETEQYEQLESVFSRFERDETPFAWQANSPPYDTLLDLLLSNLGDVKSTFELDAHLAKWTERRADARVPKLLQAQRLIQKGWKARGTGPAGTVSEEGWKVFFAHLAEARALVGPIVEEQKPPPLAYELIGILGVALGANSEQMKPFEDRLLEEAPYYLPAHAAFMQRRMPRWGGAPEDCHKYATHVADTIGGDAGDGMYARLCWLQRRSYPSHAFLQMAGLNRERFERGLLYLSGQATTEGKWAAHQGLRYAYDIRDAQVAKPFGERLKSAGWHQAWEADWWGADLQLINALKFADGTLKLAPYDQ